MGSSRVVVADREVGWFHPIDGEWGYVWVNTMWVEELVEVRLILTNDQEDLPKGLEFRLGGDTCLCSGSSGTDGNCWREGRKSGKDNTGEMKQQFSGHVNVINDTTSM